MSGILDLTSFISNLRSEDEEYKERERIRERRERGREERVERERAVGEREREGRVCVVKISVGGNCNGHMIHKPSELSL